MSRMHHKWLGLILCFFLLMACVSGLILNHRSAWGNINVSRAILPPQYRYDKWNQGLMRGTLPTDDGRVYIYGTGGVMIADADDHVHDFNKGMPKGADYRTVRSMAFAPDSTLFAAAQYGLYRLDDDQWTQVPLPLYRHERLTDLCAHGDSLIVATRDRLLVGTYPYTHFEPIDLATPIGYKGQTTLFRIVWLLHSGELLGIPGKIVIDLVALTLIFLSLTGLLIWLLPKRLHRMAVKKGSSTLSHLKWNIQWHRRIGVYALVLLLLVTVSGWVLRPPLLIPLVLTKVSGIPGTHVAPSRPWLDKIRMLQYDSFTNDWLLSTSDGLFSLDRLNGKPIPIAKAPYISVMGPNVLRQAYDGEWLVGSLSGLFIWNRATGDIYDWHTGQRDTGKARSPFGSNPVAGYTDDFGTPVAIDYYKGTDLIPQPAEMRKLPMSLFGVALEIHTGRIYSLFGLAPLIWVFLLGAATLWLLISGYAIHSRTKKKKKVASYTSTRLRLNPTDTK